MRCAHTHTHINLFIVAHSMSWISNGFITLRLNSFHFLEFVRLHISFSSFLLLFNPPCRPFSIKYERGKKETKQPKLWTSSREWRRDRERQREREKTKCARIIKWVVFIFIPFIYISSSFSLRLIQLIWHAPYIYLAVLKAHENTQCMCMVLCFLYQHQYVCTLHCTLCTDRYYITYTLHNCIL